VIDFVHAAVAKIRHATASSELKRDGDDWLKSMEEVEETWRPLGKLFQVFLEHNTSTQLCKLNSNSTFLDHKPS
jgi:hypothetical protein